MMTTTLSRSVLGDRYQQPPSTLPRFHCAEYLYIIFCLLFYRALEGILSQVCLSLSTSVNVKYFYVQLAGGVVVVPQQCTGFNDITGPEETDTARGPFRPPAKEVVNDSLSMCVSETQQSAGRFGFNKAVYPSFGFPAGLGTCTHK